MFSQNTWWKNKNQGHKEEKFVPNDNKNDVLSCFPSFQGLQSWYKVNFKIAISIFCSKKKESQSITNNPHSMEAFLNNLHYLI